MPTTIGCSFGDVVLVPFPFTDQTAAKKRPAVVISSDAYHRHRADVVVMAVTSQALARVLSGSDRSCPPLRVCCDLSPEKAGDAACPTM
jgi:hypothetical protein